MDSVHVFPSKLIHGLLTLGNIHVSIGDEQEIADLKRNGFYGRQLLDPRRVPSAETVRSQFMLSSYEAIWLLLAECLRVTDTQGQNIDVEQCWTIFYQADSNFYLKYSAYHYLRSHHWTVRAGLKYGVDFLAYNGNPNQYHSQYAVVVRAIEIKTSESRITRLNTLEALIRLLGLVSKELLICDVASPSDQDVATPDCLGHLDIQVFSFRRWAPQKARNIDLKTMDQIKKTKKGI